MSLRGREPSAAELLLERGLWDLVRELYRYDPIQHAWHPLIEGPISDYQMAEAVRQALR